METVSNCPVCNNNAFNPYLICKDYLVSNQKFSVQQCSKCGFRLTNPRPDVNSIGSYYKSDQYASHNDSGGGVVNAVYRMVRNYTLRSKLKLVNKLNKETGRILDVGCGTGSFLEVCQQGGWQVMGMEPDSDARAMSTKKVNIDIKPNLDSLEGNQPFDIITLWHVLEHIPDLNNIIPKLSSLLNKNGTLLIAVPDSDSYDAQLFKQHWAAFDVPRHLYHFVPSTIEKLFNKHGFRLMEQKPMLFDAFYISMLSTQYQMGKTNYLKSVQIGLASNAEAKRTGNASSLIYIFHKAH